MIPEPGIHMIPDWEYHGIKSVSSSLLKEMKKSCAHGLEYLNRPTESEKNLSEEKKKSFREGKLIERAILEPHRNKGLIVKPAGMSFATKEGKEWRAAHDGDEIITAKEDEMLKGVMASIARHRDASAILKSPGKAQPSLFAIDEETGLPLKARLDWLLEGNVILDIKTTTTANPALHGFPREIAKYSYHVQAAFYLDMCARLKMPKDCFVFLAVEKTAPYLVTAIQLDAMSVNKGRNEYQRLLKLYKECSDTNLWPSYSDKIEIVTLPEWSLREEAYESAFAYQLEAP